MFSTYRAVLAHPGALPFALSGLLARVPIAMHNLAIILMVQLQYDSYEMAGRVAAVGTLAWAAQSIPSARLIDRFGQRKAMIPFGVVSAVGAVIAVFVAMNQGPEWTLLIGVVMASLSGPLGSLTRARWSHILPRRQMHTAFSLEGALDEILFITGPATVTVLATLVWAPLGVIVSTTAMVIGLILLLPQTATEPPTHTETGGASLGLKVPAVVFAMTLVAAGLGFIFGAFDLSVVAFAEEQGSQASAGIIIAILSAGSLVGALIYGARQWASPLWKRTLGMTVLLAIAIGALALAPNLWWMGAIAIVAGTTLAPNLTNADSIVQRVVKPDQITEGMAWLRIGMGVGVAAGGWVAGALIDAMGARAGLLTSASGGLLVVIAAFSAISVVRTVPEEPADEPEVPDDLTTVPR